MSGLVRLGEQNPAELFVVGTPVQLTVSLADEDLCCKATLLGWKIGAYVITDLPMRDDIPMEATTGSPCEVRHVFGGRLLGYCTEVRSIQTVPEPLLFLAFPHRIDQILARKSPRVQLRQTVRMTPADPEAVRAAVPARPSLCGTIEDLSTAGCRVELVETETALSPGTLLKLEFDLPGLGRVSSLTGRLKYWRTEPMRILAGIEFQFHQTEIIEFKGWGGTVKRAIEQFVVMRHEPATARDAVWGMHS